MKAHKHANNMLLYAEDALETDKPWERWEVCRPEDCDEWIPLTHYPTWSSIYRYRRKPRFIKINGHEVPEPMREPPKEGSEYYTPILYTGGCIISTWMEDKYDFLRLNHGIVHATAEAATAHAKALISCTRIEK